MFHLLGRRAACPRGLLLRGTRQEIGHDAIVFRPPVVGDADVPLTSQSGAVSERRTSPT